MQYVIVYSVTYCYVLTTKRFPFVVLFLYVIPVALPKVDLSDQKPQPQLLFSRVIFLIVSCRNS